MHASGDGRLPLGSLLWMSILRFGSSCLVRHAIGKDRSLRASPSSMMSAANGRFLANVARVRRVGLTCSGRPGCEGRLDPVREAWARGFARVTHGRPQTS